jgi:two-component system NtrC family sensor kinase
MAVSNPYDLVITDLRMAGPMDGRDFFTKLGSERPELAERFVFISGDIMEESTAQFLKESGRQFLLKPFSMNDLRRAVEKTLTEFPA